MALMRAVFSLEPHLIESHLQSILNCSDDLFMIRFGSGESEKLPRLDLLSLASDAKI